MGICAEISGPHNKTRNEIRNEYNGNDEIIIGRVFTEIIKKIKSKTMRKQTVPRGSWI